jgi:hypothetical protein
VLDIPVGDDPRGLQVAAGAEIEGEARVLGLGPGERAGRAGGLAGGEADRGGARIATERRGRERWVLPRLFGLEPLAGGHCGHCCQQRVRAAGPSRGDVVLSALAVEHRPEMPGAYVPGRRPGLAAGRAVGGIGLIAVAVAILGARSAGSIAVEAGSVRRRALDRAVDDGQGGLHRGIGGRQDPEAHQFEEAAVDDRALVGGDAPVTEAVRDGGVRVAGLRQAKEVTGRVRPGARHRPALDVACEVIGGGLVDGGAGRVAVDGGDPRGGRQAGDLGGDRRRRVARLLLPALDAVRGPVSDQEVGGRDHVLAIEVGVAGQTGLPIHQDRIGGLVELQSSGVGRDHAVEQRVAGHRAIGLLLAIEQE